MTQTDGLLCKTARGYLRPSCMEPAVGMEWTCGQHSDACGGRWEEGFTKEGKDKTMNIYPSLFYILSLSLSLSTTPPILLLPINTSSMPLATSLLCRRDRLTRVLLLHFLAAFFSSFVLWQAASQEPFNILCTPDWLKRTSLLDSLVSPHYALLLPLWWCSSYSPHHSLTMGPCSSGAQNVQQLPPACHSP